MPSTTTTAPFEVRKRTQDGITTRRVSDRSMSATGYDTDNGHFFDVAVHRVTHVEVDGNDTLNTFNLTLRNEDGTNVYITVFGATLATLASAVEAAQRT